jgi:hypothetical protein
MQIPPAERRRTRLVRIDNMHVPIIPPTCLPRNDTKAKDSRASLPSRSPTRSYPSPISSTRSAGNAAQKPSSSLRLEPPTHLQLQQPGEHHSAAGHSHAATAEVVVEVHAVDLGCRCFEAETGVTVIASELGIDFDRKSSVEVGRRVDSLLTGA